MLDGARAVADMFGVDAHPIEHRQVQVRHRGVSRIRDVPSGTELAAVSREQDRKIVVRVEIAVGRRGLRLWFESKGYRFDNEGRLEEGVLGPAKSSAGPLKRSVTKKPRP
jgi:hypothetical protein